MDPFIANLNLAPPRQRVSLRGVVPALLAHAVLGVALASGVQWKRTPDPSRTVSVPALQAPAESTAVMGSPPASVSPSVQSQPTPVAAVPPVTQARPGPVPQRTTTPTPEPERPARVAMGAPAERPAPPPAVRATPASAAPAAAVRPSFDCAKARSAPERIICADPELSRRDRELGRLHARAKAAAPNPAAFKRQNDVEWRLRESSCRDRECLLAWYDNRREQLVETLEEAGVTVER